MLRDIKDLKGRAIAATDGELGTVKDLYFDDRRWAIRYLVVETGGWLSGRKVLISPSAVRGIAWEGDKVDVRLTQQQVRDSPSIDTDKPVSRQHEMSYYDYYGYPYYWQGAYLWGPLMYPMYWIGPTADPAPAANASHFVDAAEEREGRVDNKGEASDSHLRSCNDVMGHEAMASDGPIGRVQTFLFDDESWAIQHLIVETGNWLPGKRVMLSPRQIQRISWPGREVYLETTREAVMAGQEYVVQHVPTYQAHE
jgi:sporulation protein YlmC with PRC-barrel domain